MLSFDAPVGELGFWTSEQWGYRIPVIATFFVLLAGMTFWPRRKSLEHLTAYSAAIIVATQFWYPVQGGVYLLWYLPLLLVVVFRPRLAHLQPQTAAAESEQTLRSPVSGPHATRSKSFPSGCTCSADAAEPALHRRNAVRRATRASNRAPHGRLR